MLRPKKNSYKEFDNEKISLRLENRVPVSPKCWGQPLIGCNVNAMKQISSGVVIGE